MPAAPLDDEGAMPDHARTDEGPPYAAARHRPLAFVAVAAVAAIAVLVVTRGVFLFWDDFVFLAEARESGLTPAYLADPLFKHFSPVTRLFNWVFVAAVPGHPWVVRAVLGVLAVAVVASVTWLIVVLHGRTTRALVAVAVLAPSLTLVPLAGWWTAGVNIMPALAGFYLAFGAMVQLLRGRTRWWTAVVLGGAAVGVLDYELPMLLFGYLGLWFLLFAERVVPDGKPAALRRTAVAWVGVTAICVAALANYRLNYYDPVERAGVLESAHALGRGLVRTLLPTALGFHDPRSPAFSTFSLVLGLVVLAVLLGYLVGTRTGTWHGLLFAAAGWVLPTAALVLNRLSLYGVEVVDNAIYFHLPTVLVGVGLLEAWRAPRRPTPLVRVDLSRVPAAARRAVVALGAAAAVAGWVWSAGPTATYQLPPGASADFEANVRESVGDLLESGERFSVINSSVPLTVVPYGFRPYQRAERVLGVIAPPLDFDDPEPPYYQVSPTGTLEPVDVQWLVEAEPDDLRVSDARRAEGEGRCFRAGGDTTVRWVLPEEVHGPGLVLRTLATVDGESSLLVTVKGADTDNFDRANDDEHELRPDEPGVLDTVTASTLTNVRLKDFTPGTQVCVRSVTVGRIVPAA